MTKAVKAKYLCCDYGESLHSTFRIDITRDSPTIHPQHFCHACKNVLQRAKTEGYQHRTSLFVEWNDHIEDSCNVCCYFDTLQKGGRPRKTKRTPGRPPNNSPRYCSEHIRAIAPPPFVSTHHTAPRICTEHQVVNLRDLQCPICCDVLRSPVELVDCRSVVCGECCSLWFQHIDDISCPCCYGDHLKSFTSIRPASHLIMSLLGGLCVVCSECGHHVRLETYQQHIDSGCNSHNYFHKTLV